MSSVACSSLPYFSTLSHKQHPRKRLLNMKCVFGFSLQLLSDTFLILSRNERDISVNAHTSSRKVLVFHGRFRRNLNFLVTFYEKKKPPQVSNLMKSVQWKPCCSMRTDRHDEVYSRLSQFCESA